MQTISDVVKLMVRSILDKSAGLITDHFPVRKAASDGNKRKAPTDEEAGPSKVPNVQAMGDDPNTDTVVPMDVSPTPANSGGSAGGSTSGMRGAAPLPLGVRNENAVYERNYTKQYHIRIFNRLHEYRTPTVRQVVYNDFIPNIHEIPVDHLGFYLNFAEFQRLRGKTQVRVKQCEVDVANHSAIISYETSASQTQIGNNNLGITLIQLDPYIHKSRTGVCLNQNQAAVVSDTFLGVSANEFEPTATPSSNLKGLSAQYITRNFDNRFCYRTVRSATNIIHNNQPTIAVPMQFFNVNRHVVKRINASMQEGHFTSWSHKPKSGVIVSNNRLFPMGSIAGSRENFNVSDHRNISWRSVVLDNLSERTGLQDRPVGQAIGVATNPPGNVINDVFENTAQFERIIIDDPFTNISNRHDGIPVLAVGMDPQVGIVAASSLMTAVPCHVDLIITARCTLEITEGITYDDVNYGAIQEFDYKFPNYRMRITGAEQTVPGILLGPNDTSEPNFNEINGNTVPPDNGVPISWNFPGVLTFEGDKSESDKTEMYNTINEMKKDEVAGYFLRSKAKARILANEKRLGVTAPPTTTQSTSNNKYPNSNLD